MKRISLRLKAPDAWSGSDLDLKVTTLIDDCDIDNGVSAESHATLLMKLYREHPTITCHWADVFCEAILQSDQNNDLFLKPLVDICRNFTERSGPFALVTPPAPSPTLDAGQ